MKRILLFALPFAFMYFSAFSQSDTIYKYYGKSGKETTKDSALTFMKFYKQDNLWHGEEYFIKKSILKSEGNYAQMNFDTPVGSFKNYKEDGSLYFTGEYVDGKPAERTYYYKNGNKKSWISYSDKGDNRQKGWDENGKEIKIFVVEREAKFKSGMDGWKKYLEKHLNINVAANAGAPAGAYQVKVQFIISKEGDVTNVKAVSVPAACKPCGTEAVSVISNSPAWEPAIQNNEPVLYQAIQYVTFQVEEEKKKAKN